MSEGASQLRPEDNRKKLELSWGHRVYGHSYLESTLRNLNQPQPMHNGGGIENFNREVATSALLFESVIWLAVCRTDG